MRRLSIKQLTTAQLLGPIFDCLFALLLFISVAHNMLTMRSIRAEQAKYDKWLFLFWKNTFNIVAPALYFATPYKKPTGIVTVKALNDSNSKTDSIYMAKQRAIIGRYTFWNDVLTPAEKKLLSNTIGFPVYTKREGLLETSNRVYLYHTKVSL